MAFTVAGLRAANGKELLHAAVHRLPLLDELVQGNNLVGFQASKERVFAFRVLVALQRLARGHEHETRMVGE